jgi:predicted phosphodiesterase
MTRIAIFSDIHGNCVGLDAMLADQRAEPPDAWLCLGDAVQGGPQPAQVVQRLRELRCPVVMGNADAWLLSGVETADEGASPARRQVMNDVRQWSLAQLGEGDRAFMAGFKPTVEIAVGDGFKLLGYHGSPKSFDDLILPDIEQEKLIAYLDGASADAYCGGHTHVQFVRRVGAGPRVHFNPGSVGFAYSHHQSEASFQADSWAEYALLTVESGRFGLEFRRVAYQAAALIAAYESSGRPHAAIAIEQYRQSP